MAEHVNFDRARVPSLQHAPNSLGEKVEETRVKSPLIPTRPRQLSRKAVEGKSVIVKIPGAGAVVKRGNRYIMVLDPNASSVARQYTGEVANVYITHGMNTIALRARLGIETAYHPERVKVNLPSALTPTWEKLHGQVVAVLIELEER